jgi:hypothetical protein
MPLPDNHPLSEVQVSCHSASIGASAAAAFARAPFRGRIVRLAAVTGGIITSADSVIATAINGTAITGGEITILVSGAAAGQEFSVEPKAAFNVIEGDVGSCTPAGASGSSIPGSFVATIRRA